MERKELKHIPIYKGNFNATHAVKSSKVTYVQRDEKKEEDIKIPLANSYFEIATLALAVSYLLVRIIY